MNQFTTPMCTRRRSADHTIRFDRWSAEFLSISLAIIGNIYLQLLIYQVATMADVEILYNERPSDPPRTAVPWLTNKKCYRDAQVTSLARDAPLKESSEYSTEFKKKQAKLEQPVLVRDIDPAKGMRTCAARGAFACRGNSEDAVSRVDIPQQLTSNRE